MLRLRFDSLQVGATPIEVRPGGSKVYRGVASYGDVVLDYGPMDPGGARSEFVPASTALDPETVRLTEGIPFTILHPGDLLEADDEDAIKEHTEGSVLRAEADWSTTPPSLKVDVIVHTRSAQDDIESGRVRELSLGYACDDEDLSGVHDGKTYTVVQRRRRPNHLSGVPRARSRTADGRAARLDAAPGPVDIDITPTVEASTLARATTAGHYAHLDAGAPMEDETKNANTDAPEIVAETEAAVVADPAEALAAFSPEDAEVLKTLSPEGLAMLAKAVKQVKAEAAEQAVLAAPDVAAAIAPSDAPAPALEVESTEEMVEEAGDDPNENDDATAPMAPGGATPDLDAIGKMLADLQSQFDAMKAGKPKSDATATASPARHVVDPAKLPASSKTKADAVAEQARLDAEKRKQDDARFVTAIRKQVGSRARLDSAHDAAREALATIGHQTPEVLAVAKRAWDERRLDDLASLAAAADRKRRDVHLDAQGAVVAAVQSAEADYLARQLGDFRVPQRAVSGG